MKKTTLLLLMASSLVAAQAMANPAYIDVSASSQTPGGGGTTPGLGGDLDTFTSLFDHLQLFADTTTTQYDTDSSGTLTIGDKFSDDGDAAITSLLPPLGDEEGLGFLSELTMSWSGLTGYATSGFTAVGPEMVQTIAYDTTNTTFSFYFHGDAGGPDGAPNSDFGAAIGSADNTGFTDGQKVLEILIKGGTGTNKFDLGGNFLTGSSVLMGEITYALDNFWWFDNGDGIAGTPGDNDFHDLLGMAIPITLRSSIDQNTDEVMLDDSGAGSPGPAGFGAELFKVNSTHDGSINFSVPEPGTLALLGLGLVLVPVIRRRILAKSLV